MEAAYYPNTTTGSDESTFTCRGYELAFPHLNGKCPTSNFDISKNGASSVGYKVS